MACLHFQMSLQNGSHFVQVQHVINSLWPSDTIWSHRSGSPLPQVMACCLMAPNHYVNRCWLLISEALRHSPEVNFTRNLQIYPSLIICLKITNLTLQLHLIGANELINTESVVIPCPILASVGLRLDPCSILEASSEQTPHPLPWQPEWNTPGIHHN